MSQNDIILKHLKSGKSITQMEAARDFDCYRLGARIYDLKQKGHSIVTDIVELVKSNGDKVRFANYWLEVN